MISGTGSPRILVADSGESTPVVFRGSKCPFIDINSTAITESLLEGELSGHIKGDRCGRLS